MSTNPSLINTLSEIENSPTVGNTPDNPERRRVLQTFAAGTAMVFTADMSGALGTFNAPIAFDQISTIQKVNEVFSLDKKDSIDFDVRESYGLVRTVFGGTIGRTAEYYGVSRKTIYQWINSEGVPTLQARQAQRAKLLESAAKHVRSQLGEQSKKYTLLSTSGLSLDAILVAEKIDLAELRSCVEEIQNLINSNPQEDSSLSANLEKKGFFPPDGEDDLDPLIM